jgi:hypothetical protein
MKAQLMLEAIGWGRVVTPALRRLRPAVSYNPKPWVAEVVPGTKGKLWDRAFLQPSGNDYREANGRGSRGVRRHYILESGKLYEVQRMTAWEKAERVFLRVTEQGDIEELSREEVLECLRKNRV